MRRLQLTLLVALAFWGIRLPGAEPSPPSGEAKAVKHGDTPNPESEARVLAFLSQHHPELAEVLSHLRASLPFEYDRAIRDLSRVCDRLAQVRDRDGDRYELELKTWVVQSRIQLAVARLAMGDSPGLRDELRSLLERQLDVKLELLRDEQQRQSARLQKLNEQIQELDNDRAAYVERQFNGLTDSYRRMSTKAKGAAKKPKKPAEAVSGG